MNTYKEMKTALKSTRENIKYFTKEFYEIFVEAYRTSIENKINGKDDYYEKDYISLNHCYDKVYKSDFYTKNGPAYCQFLEVFYDKTNLPKYRIEFFRNDYSYSTPVHRMEIYLEDDNIAKRYVDTIRKEQNMDYVDISKI